jgi:hypothetical protein
MSLYGRPAGPHPGRPEDPWPEDPWPGAPGAPGPQGSGAAPLHDPFADHRRETPRYDQWGSQAFEAGAAHTWGPPQPPPTPRRGGSGLVIALVVVLGLLVLGGGGAALYLLSRDDGGPVATPPLPSTSGSDSPSANASPSPTESAPAPSGSGVPNADTRTAKTGDCLVNRGSENKPDMHKVACATETYQVLKRLDGTADRKKCDGTPGLTDWYFFDSPDPASDFVLCLRKR